MLGQQLRRVQDFFSVARSGGFLLRWGRVVVLGVPCISILSRDPSFKKASGNPGTAASSWKERWLKIMDKESTLELYVKNRPELAGAIGRE